MALKTGFQFSPCADKKLNYHSSSLQKYIEWQGINKVTNKNEKRIKMLIHLMNTKLLKTIGAVILRATGIILTFTCQEVSHFLN